MEWRRQANEQLRAVVTGAIQLVAIRERAAAVGISPDKMLAIVVPVPVTNVELSQVAGRTRDDETAAFIMTVLLFMSVARSSHGSCCGSCSATPSTPPCSVRSAHSRHVRKTPKAPPAR